MSNSDHIVMDSNTQTFRCLRCGDSWPLNLPAALDDVAARGKAFIKLHRFCPKPNSTSPAEPEQPGG